MLSVTSSFWHYAHPWCGVPPIYTKQTIFTIFHILVHAVQPYWFCVFCAPRFLILGFLCSSSMSSFAPCSLVIEERRGLRGTSAATRPCEVMGTLSKISSCPQIPLHAGFPKCEETAGAAHAFVLNRRAEGQTCNSHAPHAQYAHIVFMWNEVNSDLFDLYACHPCAVAMNMQLSGTGNLLRSSLMGCTFKSIHHLASNDFHGQLHFSKHASFSCVHLCYFLWKLLQS